MSLSRRTMVAVGTVLAIGATGAAVLPTTAGAVAKKKRAARAAISNPGVSDHVSASGLIIVNPTNGAFRVVSTRCSVASADDANPVACVLTASGTGGDGSFHLTSRDGSVSSTLSLCGCGQLSGEGTETDETGTVPVSVSGQVSQTPTASPRLYRFTAEFDVIESAI